jgi:uncharacterized protein
MIRIELKVITRAKKEEISRISENKYRVKTSVPPEKGRANERIIEMLCEKFGVKRKDIEIVSGEISSRKIVEIDI